MNARIIGRYEKRNRLLRLLLFTWQRAGYSAKLSIGLRPCLFLWHREYGGWICAAAGLRVHYDRSYGGTHV